MFGGAYFGASYYGGAYFGLKTTAQESGGAKKTRVKKRKKLTPEEIKGLEVVYGRGMVEPLIETVEIDGEIIQEISPSKAEEKGILIYESLAGLVLGEISEIQEVTELQEVQESQVIDEDILLILAIAQATDSL